MPSKLDQLRRMSVVVGDTGDAEAIRTYRPVDCTTNPTILLKAAELPAYRDLLRKAVDTAVHRGGNTEAMAQAAARQFTVSVGAELAGLVPGRVSTEVDADLSFDAAATMEQARHLIDDYEARGLSRDRVLVKIAATWEGIAAARALEREGIRCNMTLVFSLVQARACAEAGAYLISPFVGRVLDWHVKTAGRPVPIDEHPGIRLVKLIYADYKARGIDTIVMAASFRGTAEIEALAGCDRLTVAPALLGELADQNGELARALCPDGQHAVEPAPLVGEAAFRLTLNEDAMACEKLAEGIRLFTRDLRALRQLMARLIDKKALMGA